LPILGVIRPGATSAALATRNRRVGVIGTPATIRSHAYFAAIKDENPAVEVYEHATPTFVPMVEAGLLTGPEVETSVREALAPLLGERDAAGEFIFPLPASARVDTLLLGCTHYPLIRDAIASVAGPGVAIVDSAAATASALAELLSINGLDAPADAASHQQLTTGDVDAFRSIAERMFGEAFPDVAGIELGAEAAPVRLP
jgi:glutamate racemase